MRRVCNFATHPSAAVSIPAVRLGSVLYVVAVAAELLGGCACVSDAGASTRATRGALVTAPSLVIAAATRPLLRTATDADGDGIDDARELSIAKDYFPYFSIHPGETCSRHGVLFRVSPHPGDATKIAIWYVVLYERDCGLHGLGAHVGDDEVFGEVVDPERPAPAGILALRAISHQNTTCERITTCGSLPRCEPCATAPKEGRPYPVVFSSYSKHGNYASESVCNGWLCDFSGCEMSGTPDVPPLVNAGEPGAPLSENLTAAGFVNTGGGWSEPSLMNFNPWGNAKFGTAGNVTDDLMDSSFVVSLDGCQ
jgi:hypothetical protein